MKFLQSLRSDDKLVPLLNAYFEAGVFPPEMRLTIRTGKERDSAYHPSSHAYECARVMFAARAGDTKPEKPSGSLHRVFHLGHMYHEWIQGIVVDMGLAKPEDIEKRHKVDWVTEAGNSWWALGYADIASCVIPEHGDYLVDIKTTSSFSFSSDQPGASFLPKYIAQLQVYMDWHGKEKSLLLWINKDNGQFKETEVSYDADMVDAIYAKWDVVADALAADLPPACTCSDSTQCPVRGLYA